MPDIEDYSHYTLSELRRAVNWPWRKFAKWADVRLPIPEDDPNPYIGKFRHGFHTSTFGEYEPIPGLEADDWFRLVEQLLLTPLGEDTITESWKEVLRSVIGKDFAYDWDTEEVTTGLYGKIRKLNKLLKEAVDWKIKGRKASRKVVKLFNWCSKEDIRKLRWVAWVVRNRFAHERMFWVRVREGVRGKLPQLLAVERAIREKRPLKENEYQVFDQFSLIGNFAPKILADRSGAISIISTLTPMGEDDPEPTEDRVQMLLTPVVYQLGVAWEKSQRWPRFILTCRNPACGNEFYSGRRSAVACSKPNGTNDRSECKRIWDAYRKWLKKVYPNKDPDKTWSNSKFKKEFLSQYHPRGSQSGVH